jgi:hypothetical protein
MAFLQRDHLTTGELINGTFAELRANLRPVLIYLTAIIGLALIAESGPAPIDSIASLAGMVAYFGGLYLLFESMLRNAGHLPVGPSRRYFRFVGMAFLVLFGVILASNFFLIPGIIVAARWIMAPSILVETRQGVFTSLSQSWSLTSGNTLSIALAFTALVLIAFAAAVGIAAAAGAAGEASGIIGSLLLHGANLLLVGLSLTVYRRLNEEGSELAEVFA